MGFKRKCEKHPNKMFFLLLFFCSFLGGGGGGGGDLKLS